MIKIMNEFEEAFERIKDFVHDEDNIEVWSRSYLLTMDEKLEVIDDLIRNYKDLKNSISTGDVFSPQGFYDDYEDCLRGDGLATFVTKDLEIISDFQKGWDMLIKAIDKYGILDNNSCEISFVIWFNR